MVTNVESNLTKDDVELASAIFEGSASSEEIAQRFGISARQVRYIATGASRPEIGVP